jgi:hypothetical protein
MGSYRVPIKEESDEMPIYVVLGNFTQKRMETIARAIKVNALYVLGDLFFKEIKMA